MEEIDEAHFVGVAGFTTWLPNDRPDLLLLELRTIYGVTRFALTKQVATSIGRELVGAAQKLGPDSPVN
jgi:hypothetical protein